MSQSKIFNFVDDHRDIIKLVHDKVTPADIRFGELITAKLIFQDTSIPVVSESRVWRLSPLGIEFVISDQLEMVSVGDKVDLEVRVGTQLSFVKGKVVAKDYLENGISLMGVRFFMGEQDLWRGVERRVNKRWSCSSEFMPNGVAPNPGRFNDFIFFRVFDLSSRGMRLVTSLRNKFLIPGMELSSSVSFPMVGQTHINFRIQNVRIQSEGGNDVLSVGVEFLKNANIDRDIIGQYIFQYGPKTSIDELKTENLNIIESASALNFSYVRSEEEYDQVLNLRSEAYKAAGKIDNDAEISAVSDVYDTRSRIVIAKYRGDVIASARLIFNEIGDDMEHEQFITLPANFPRKDEICEITRVCTHPKFRGNDILLELFRFMALTVVQSNRKYVMGCGTDKILKLYKNMGFEITDLTYEHKDLNNIKHTVFLGDVKRGLSGVGINPIYWNIVWGDLYKYLSDSTYIDENPITKIRVSLFRMLKPLSVFLHRLKRNKKHSKKAH